MKWVELRGPEYFPHLEFYCLQPKCMSVLFKYNQPLMNSLNYMWKMCVVCYDDSKLSLFGRLGILQSLYSCYRPSTTAHEWKWFAKRSAREIRSTIGLPMNLRKSPQTMDELQVCVALHYWMYSKREKLARVVHCASI